MAALNATNPTLLDLAKMTDPNGSIGEVVEIMNETNEILDHMTWQEGNLPTGNQSIIRTGIPAPTWKKYYGGVQPNKGTTAQIVDNCGRLQAYAEVDADLADLAPNKAAFRLSEDRVHIEGIAQEVANTMFYGNDTLIPETFMGFGPRYNSLSAVSGENIVNGGGSGSDMQSIWLVVFSPRTVFGIIPRGSKAGMQVEDKGRVTLEDASGGSNTGRMEAYRTLYKFDAGLCVKDWRYVVRIANIDRSLMLKDAATGPDLPDLMFQAMNLIPNLSVGRAVFCASRQIITMLGRQTANLTKNSSLQFGNVGGKMVRSFNEIPVVRVDALSADEAAVT